MNDPILIKKDKFARIEKTSKALNIFLEKAKTTKATTADITTSAKVICMSNEGFENMFIFHNLPKS